MPQPRTAKSNVAFVFLVAGAFRVSGAVIASPNPGTQQGRLFSSQPQQGHLIPPHPSQQFPITVEVLSSLPEGVDLDPYLRNLYVSIRRNLLAKLPESTVHGEKGVVVVLVHIQKDGSLLPERAVIIVSSSARKDMDAAAQNAIRTAAPFGPLPDAYPGSNLDLLFTFSYKSIPQEPAQKPKVVPIATMANYLSESLPMERC
jgi:TonB family protein